MAWLPVPFPYYGIKLRTVFFKLLFNTLLLSCSVRIT